MLIMFVLKYENKRGRITARFYQCTWLVWRSENTPKKARRLTWIWSFKLIGFWQKDIFYKARKNLYPCIMRWSSICSEIILDPCSKRGSIWMAQRWWYLFACLSFELPRRLPSPQISRVYSMCVSCLLAVQGLAGLIMFRKAKPTW